MSNKVEYFSCSSCGAEGFDVILAYSRTAASGDLYLCPHCNREVWDVEADEE